MLIDELNSGYYGPYMKKLLNKQLFTYIQNIKLDHLDNLTNLVKVATGDLPMDAKELQAEIEDMQSKMSANAKPPKQEEKKKEEPKSKGKSKDKKKKKEENWKPKGGDPKKKPTEKELKELEEQKAKEGEEDLEFKNDEDKKEDSKEDAKDAKEDEKEEDGPPKIPEDPKQKKIFMAQLQQTNPVFYRLMNLSKLFMRSKDNKVKS